MFSFILFLILVFRLKDLGFGKEYIFKKRNFLFDYMILKILWLQIRRRLFFISLNNFSVNETIFVNTSKFI